MDTGGIRIQCENYCNKLGVKMEAMADTAGSAMHIIKEGLTETAAICSARAADIYGLDVRSLSASLPATLAPLAPTPSSVLLNLC
jgi:hypothetical protein